MKFNYGSLLLIIFSFILFQSCKVYDESLLKMDVDPLDPKLPPLQMVYGSFNNTMSYGNPCACELNMLSDELEYNLSEFYGEQYGYISFQIRRIDYGYSAIYILPFLCTFGAINILGLPFPSYMLEIELNVAIMDSKRQLLKKYTGRAKEKVKVAYYYGYREKYAPLLVQAFALNSAMSVIRKEIRADAVGLREKLLSAGPIIED